MNNGNTLTASRLVNRLDKGKGSVIRFVILILIIIFAQILNRSFLTPYNINSLLIMIAIYGFLGLAQTMVMFIGELNLTLGVQLAFAPVMGLQATKLIYSLFGKEITLSSIYIVDGLIPIFLIMMLTGAALGFVCGWLTLTFKVPSLIITLGMQYLLTGLCYEVSGSAAYCVYLTIPGIDTLTSSKFIGLPLCFWLLIICGGIMIFLMHYTKFGRRMYATGGNAKAAAYAGINTKFWKILAFVLSGLFCSMAALVWTSRMESVDPSQGAGMQFYALAIAVIGGVNIAGGKGTIAGTLIGSAIMTVAMNLMSMIGLYSWYQNVAIGAIILITSTQQAIELYRETHK